MRSAPVGWVAGLLAALWSARAGAAPNPKRTVAVLEFRSGSSELASIDQRLAALLAKATSIDVVDSTEARKRASASIDQAVVRCAGAAGCIARIGKRLGASEVLLVGVSEFGDVILTLQRIDVRRGKVVARVAEALGRGASPSDEVLTGYLERVMPKSDFIRYGLIHIDSPVRGARVSVDKKRRGTTPVAPLRVRAPASYQIDVTKKGYLPFRTSIKVPPDAEVRVRALLSRRSSGAWYTSWWAATIAGTVVIGAVATAVIVSRRDVTEVPARIPPF